MSFATVLHFWWCFWPKSGIKPSTGPVFEPSMWSHPLLNVPTCPQGSSRRPRSISGLYEVPSNRWRAFEYGGVGFVQACVRVSTVGRPVGPELVPAGYDLWSVSRRHPRWHAPSTVLTIARRVLEPVLRRRVLQGQLRLPHLLRRRSLGRPTPPDSRFLDGHRSERFLSARRDAAFTSRDPHRAA